MLITTNPATGQPLSSYDTLDKEELRQAISCANGAYPRWRSSSFEDRAAVMVDVAAALRADKSGIARLMADEMGKPLKEGEPEVEKAAWSLEHYAEHAAGYLADQVIASDAHRSYVRYQPLGTVLGILPWNAPLWIAFRFLAPALMAGNTCAMKHDPNVQGSAAAIEQAFVAAGAPDNIMVNLPLANDNVEAAIRDPGIAAVSFTGSSRTGARVASCAASEIKPHVLELGGSDPFVVLEDADLERAADVAVLSRIINAGQSCIAAKRVIVADAVYDQFIELLTPRLSRLSVGSPLQPETDVGPIAREDLRANLHHQVQASIDAGARCLLGGELPTGGGFFYPLTLLVDVEPGMQCYEEETFGPVMSVVRAADAEDAIRLVNDTEYGLGAGLWTADRHRGEQLAKRIEAGQVAVNGIVKTDPRLPSGGIGKSGYGRELGPQGIHEFVNAKQIWIG
ncbi:MAG: NAD-dependent succinate-semialdehyde dehydrogenase [Proteobacteria bacterium]|nr:NAD-dependent succinate-semialdehyde dehydrogenase [Pseudomonadota bacterium]